MLIIIVLIILGLCFGSFVNALTWRVRQRLVKKDKKLSILHGRSMCPKCRHELSARDLMPVLSWLILRGRCRYCKKPISSQYPIVEIAVAAVFLLSYLFWAENLETNGQLLLFITWLATSLGLAALLVYDWKWMILPSKILYPTAAVAALGKLAHLLLFESDKYFALWQWVLSILVASGIFWLIYTLSNGKWIGFGDVRLGLISGTVLADPVNSLLMIFTASIIGTLFVLPGLFRGNKELTSKIPYGPFLIVGTFVALLFSDNVLDWYKQLLT